MARIDLSLAKILYFCNVKNLTRHVVAAESSVFRAYNFKEKSYPNDGGSSNAHKGSALDTLTHRIGVFICQKFNVMTNENKTQQDALLLEAAKNIQNVLNDFWGLPELWKRLSRATLSVVMCQKLISEGRLPESTPLDDMVELCNCMDMLLEALEPLKDASK